MKFDVSFYDGPESDRCKRIVIEAANADEAMNKACNMPEARYYTDVTVGERPEGLRGFMIQFKYEHYWFGEFDKIKGQQMIINAESEDEATAAYNKMFLGKYFYDYYSRRPGKDNVYTENPLNQNPKEPQVGKYGRVKDVYSVSSTPYTDKLYAKEILGK